MKNEMHTFLEKCNLLKLTEEEKKSLRILYKTKTALKKMKSLLFKVNPITIKEFESA